MVKLTDTNTRAPLVWLFTGLFAILLAARLCHADILWADEDYHLAAAIQVLYGKIPYRDFWYDKPFLNIAACLSFAAKTGWLLRLASAIYATLLCGLAYVFASQVWTRREGYAAALVSAFSLTFYFPAPTLTMEPDTLMMLPHLAAVYLAWRGRPLLAGVVAGIATWFNVKGLFVLAACAAFGWRGLPLLALGFLIPNAIALGWLAGEHALAGYWQQVWEWGFLYSRSPRPVSAGFKSLMNWTGFHAALALATAVYFARKSAERRALAIWFAVSFAGTAIGLRFAPRYLDQLLPPLWILGARGVVLLRSESKPAVLRAALMIALGIALTVPAIRFGPRYFLLARDELAGVPHRWIDVLMDQDTQAAARLITGSSQPGDTVFIWGYRPGLIAYTRLAAGSRIWDSQPLTGVPADRHFLSDQPLAPQWAAEIRKELIASRPTFVSDGLSFFNPKLDPHRFPEVAHWLENYCVIGSTTMTVVYRWCGP